MKISKIRPPPTHTKSRAWARQGLPVILQAPQGLGRPHLTLKVTSADKVRIITRSEEHKQDSNSHSFSQKSQATWQEAACRDTLPTQT